MATITGTDDADALAGSSGNGVIFGLAGDDSRSGDAGGDMLDGADVLAGQEGVDPILGGAGNDTVQGDARDAGDATDGGGGEDMFDYCDSGGLRVDLTQGFPSSGTHSASIENIWGHVSNDSVGGDGEVNHFSTALTATTC